MLDVGGKPVRPVIDRSEVISDFRRPLRQVVDTSDEESDVRKPVSPVGAIPAGKP